MSNVLEIRITGSLSVLFCIMNIVLSPTYAQGPLGFSDAHPLHPNSFADDGSDISPLIVSISSGVWMTVWYTHSDLGEGNGTDGDIVFAHSVDDGDTWTSPSVMLQSMFSDAGQDSQPRLATDHNGNWICAWYSTENHLGLIGTDSDILAATSADNGFTWSGPIVVNSHAYADDESDARPELLTNGTGHWICTWQSDVDIGGNGDDRDILVAHSWNNGTNWTQATWLNDNATIDSGADWFPHLEHDGNETWICVWASTENLGGLTGTDFDILYAKSTDGGMTWSDPDWLNANATTDTGADGEITVGGTIRWGPRIEYDGTGTWVALWASKDNQNGLYGTDSDILSARSTDAGVTWSYPQAVNPNWDSDFGGSGSFRADQAVKFVNDGQGNWVAVWESQAFTNPPPYDYDVVISRSTDSGQTWSPMKLLNHNGHCDSGWDYSPEIATDGQGHWIAIWFSSDPLYGGGSGIFGETDIVFTTSSNLDAPEPVNNSMLLSHTIPQVMEPGQILNIGITLRNTGNTTWATESCYSLGVLEDPQNLFMGAQRISISPPNPAPGAESTEPGIAPGKMVQFIQPITAPGTPGMATARLRMLREHVEWFGEVIEISINIAEPANAARGWLNYE